MLTYSSIQNTDYLHRRQPRLLWLQASRRWRHQVAHESTWLWWVVITCFKTALIVYLVEDITPYDALVLCELNESFAPSTGSKSIHSPLEGQLVPRRGVVTSPNVSWLPYVTVAPLPVQAHTNGQFAHADFTICPQWWFSKTAHLTFVLQRPLEQDINKHPLYWLWWDVRPRHFKPVEGSAFKDLGTLDEQIQPRLY